MSSDPVVVTYASLREWLLPNEFQDKESRGRTLIVGGGSATPGAVLLAAEAALRVGAGKLQVATAASVAAPLGVALPEAMVVGVAELDSGALDPEAVRGELAELVEQASAVVVGPGMRGLEQTAELVRRVVPLVRGTLVLDALGLAAVSQQPDLLAGLEGRAILTPNTAELALTLGEDDGPVDDDVPAAAHRLAQRASAVVTSGGARSSTVTPDGRLWLDSAGGKGLGVSGSGDVLAGAVVGLAARASSPEQAAVWAVHLHRRAGDRLAADIGRTGFLARELAAQFPRVLMEIEV